jgi:adenosine kinase
MLTVNEYEHKLIQDKTGLNEDQILQRVGSLLVTLAGEGARLVVDGTEIRIPSISPNTITDPTGAGDAFRAGLMRGMQLGLPWEIAGRMGALAATYVLEQMGTQNHHYSTQDFVARYRQHFDDDGALDVLLTD